MNADRGSIRVTGRRDSSRLGVWAGLGLLALVLLLFGWRRWRRHASVGGGSADRRPGASGPERERRPTREQERAGWKRPAGELGWARDPKPARDPVPDRKPGRRPALAVEVAAGGSPGGRPDEGAGGFIDLPLSRRDRRAIVLGAIAAAAILGYVAGVRPLFSEARELERRRDAAIELVRRYRGAVMAQPAYETTLERAEARLERLLPLTYVGARPEAVAGQVLRRVNAAAEENAVRVVQSRPLPIDSVTAGLERIGVVLEAESDLRGLLGLLGALEADARLIHVSGLSVATAGLNVEDVERLRLGLTVRAFATDPGGVLGDGSTDTE